MIPDTSSSTGALATLSFERQSDEMTNHSNFDCAIDSLEVYRGRQKAIEIDHKGFTITARGTVEVNCSALIYFDDFVLNEFKFTLQD